MAAVLIAFTWYSRPSEEQLKAQRDRDSIAAVQHQKALEAEAAAAAAESSSSASTPIDSTSALFAVSQGTEQLITLENELVRITINTHGGMVEEAVIKNHLDQQKQPVRLLSKEDASMTLSLAGKQENIVTRDLYFQIASSADLSPSAPSDNSSSPADSGSGAAQIGAEIFVDGPVRGRNGFQCLVPVLPGDPLGKLFRVRMRVEFEFRSDRGLRRRLHSCL